MRIAIVSSFLFDSSVGGAENHIRFLAKEFVEKGHEVKIFKPEWGRPSEEYTVDGLVVSRIGLGKRVLDPRMLSGSGLVGHMFALFQKLSFNVGSLKMVRAIRAWNPDVVWQHDFLSSWLCTRILSRRIPTVLTNHQGQYLIMKKFALGRFLAKCLFRHYSFIIGPSSELTPDEHEHSVTIFNGVNTDYFRSIDHDSRMALRERLFGKNQKFVILCPRRWAPIKGVIHFAESLALVNASEPQLAERMLIVFAGNESAEYPQYRDSVHRVLGKCGIDMLLLGDLDIYKMREFYQSADLIVIPSLLEAVSLAALEAMACGTPVLATKVGGMPEIIEHKKTGFLVEPGSAEALRSGICEAIETPKLRETIGNSSEMAIRQSFGWRVIASRTEHVLRNAIESGRLCELRESSSR